MNLVEKSKLISLLNRVLKQVGKQITEREISYICPFHRAVHNVQKKKFGINLDTGEYNCFACGESGKSYKTLFKKLKVSSEIFRELNKIIGNNILVDKPFVAPTQKEVLALPSEFQSMTEVRKNPEYYRALNFLNKRKVTRDDVLRYNIGYCTEGIYQNRIIVPSYDRKGNLNFFAARDWLGTSKYKYLFPKWSKDIIGLELFINWNEPITLVEGIFDAISVRRNVIPLYGKNLSFSLKEALLENDVRRVNICLDEDALKDSLRIANYLKRYGNIDIHLVRFGGKDPSELGFEKITEAINNSKQLDFEDLLTLKISI